MSCYVITNQTVKNTKKAIAKFSKDVQVDSEYLRGKFTIKTYRRYLMVDEVDVIFEGEIKVNFQRKKDWYSSEIMVQKYKDWRVSKIKVNRFIRRQIYKYVKLHLNYFDIRNFHSYHLIKKITWK